MEETHKMERVVGLLVATGVIVFICYLLWRGEPFASPDLAVLARIILSLGVAVLGATIPGFLNVEFSGMGLVVRAAGALGLFVITYFGTPHVEALKLAEADVRIAKIKQIDFRTRASPKKSDKTRKGEVALLTVPISFKNVTQPGKSAFLNSVSAMLKLGALSATYDWRYFVKMHEENFGVWLGIEGSAAPRVIPAGDVLNLEVLTWPVSEVAWGHVLEAIESASNDRIDVAVNIDVDGTVYVRDCSVKLQAWRERIRKFVAEHDGRIPGRITMPCEAAA